MGGDDDRVIRGYRRNSVLSIIFKRRKKGFFFSGVKQNSDSIYRKEIIFRSLFCFRLLHSDAARPDQRVGHPLRNLNSYRMRGSSPS